MSGHSKWATIKRAKSENDSARGRLFTKLGKEITVAVKIGGADPAANTRLREAMAKARQNNMANDNIQRCIKNAVGDANKNNYEDITYEGYGPGGVAVLVEALTDNKNRTAGEIRHIFDRCGGGMGVSGAVSYLFLRVENDTSDESKDIPKYEFLPEFTVPVPEDKEALFEKLLDMLDENDDVQAVWHNAE